MRIPLRESRVVCLFVPRHHALDVAGSGYPHSAITNQPFTDYVSAFCENDTIGVEGTFLIERKFIHLRVPICTFGVCPTRWSYKKCQAQQTEHLAIAADAHVHAFHAPAARVRVSLPPQR